MSTNYDIQAEKWGGDQPKHLSDFIARPVVLERIKEIGKGKKVLDIGCGTGYFSRKMTPYVDNVVGFEPSLNMLEIAKKEEESNPRGITYMQGDMTDMSFLDQEDFDICVLNFVLPYITPDKYVNVYKGIKRVLKPGGRFLVVQGHPAQFALAPNHPRAKSDFNYKDYTDLSGEYFESKLPKANGDILTVGHHHFTFEDIFNPLEESGLAIQSLKELKVTKEVAEILDGAEEGEIPYIYFEGISL